MITWGWALVVLALGVCLGALAMSWLIAWGMVHNFGEKWWLRLQKQQLYVKVGDHYSQISGSWDDPC